MIFSIWPRVAVKLGDERHIFDRSKLLFSEVAEIEKVTGLSYAEWERELGRYSITAVAALLHVLRRRDGMPSDFKTMEFAASDLECVPVHDDDSEYTAEEATAELEKRIADARGNGNGAGPTPAANGQEAPSGAAGPSRRRTSTRPSSPGSTGSGRGNGNGSPTGTSSPSRPMLTAG